MTVYIPADDKVVDIFGNDVRHLLSDYSPITSDEYDDYTELVPLDQHEIALLKSARDAEELALIEQRWTDLRTIQELYPTFDLFLQDMYTDLFPSFKCTALQLDIAGYLEHGPLYRMIQAQRGQAKTTITAAYAVWRIIHNPKTRTLIFSAGGDMASQIALWVIQIIQGMDILSPLRPDIGNRDRIQRSSVSAFDVHWALKGAEKSPSVACLGITANMQGFRSDILIADDIESSKNSMTELMREQLDLRLRDFPSICSTGDVIFLGTPQSSESVYNRLPDRGFDLRIWPGRYPTTNELENYNNYLAPSIQKALIRDPTLSTGGGPTGKRGKPTDPVLLPEDVLTKKEIAQTSAYFQLQHMLDTRLTDELRYPLKLRDCMFMSITPETDSVPSVLRYVPEPARELLITNGGSVRERVYRPYVEPNTPFVGIGRIFMYIDPAGGGANGDETGYAIGMSRNGYIYLLDVGGVAGGYSVDKYTDICKLALKWNVSHIEVEQNYGNGAYLYGLIPILNSVYGAVHKNCTTSEFYETGQKELRIADGMEPVIARHKLIINEAIIKKDVTSCEQYAVTQRASYQFFHQLTKLTRDRDSLKHDDRLDATWGLVRYLLTNTITDEDKAIEEYKAQQYQQFVSNPLARNDLVDMNQRIQVVQNVTSIFKNVNNKSRFV
jgi:hypothetical protein